MLKKKKILEFFFISYPNFQIYFLWKIYKIYTAIEIEKSSVF